VLVIDEIGKMEMKSRKFAWMLDKVMDSDTPLIISLGKDYVNKYRALGEVYSLSGSNRRRVYSDILRKAKEGIGKKPPKKVKKPKKPEPKKKKKKREPKKELKKAKKKAAKKKAPKKAEKPKKAAKKKAAPKKVKKAPPRKEEPKHAEEAQKKAMKELEEGEDEDKGFMGKVKDLLGF
jgi:membrane peptidoglycan carboxypeptidase